MMMMMTMMMTVKLGSRFSQFLNVNHLQSAETLHCQLGLLSMPLLNHFL